MTMSKLHKATLAEELLRELMAKRAVLDDSLKLVLDKRSWLKLQNDINLVENHKYNPPPPITDQVKRDLQKYLEKVAEGDRLFNRAERTSRKVTPSFTTKRKYRMQGHSNWGSLSSREILYRRAEGMYESALETLSELNENGEFDQYMDRPIGCDSESINRLTPDSAGVPRLRNSRSQHNRYERPPSMSVRKLKIAALNSWLKQLEFMR